MTEYRKVISLEIDAKAAQRGSDEFVRSMEKAKAATLEMAAAEDKATAAAQKANVVRIADLRSVDGVTRAHQKAEAAMQQASIATQRAYAVNQAYATGTEESYRRVAKAFGDAGRLAVEHPILVAAGAAAGSRALAGMAGAAATHLGAASAASARWAAANDDAARGVVTAANLAARGLGAAEAAAGTAAAGLGAVSSKITSLTTATGLAARGLSVVTPILSAVAVGFVAFEAGAALVRKANGDLEQLIATGKQAEALDVGGAFVRQFQDIGARLGIEVAAIEAALQRASSFSRDEFGKPNALAGAIGSYDAAGATGISARTREQAELAKTTEERIRLTLTAMGELEAKGQRLAALDLSGKVFGPEVTERLRTGQTTVAAIVAELGQVQGGALVNQDDVARAVALEREIAAVKAEIGRALDVTLDFSKGALSLKETWRDILVTMRDYTPNLAGIVKQGDAATLVQIQTLQAQMESMRNVSLPDAVSKGQADRVQYILQLLDSWQARIDSLSSTMGSAAAQIDADVGRIGEPLRFTSDQLQVMLSAAESAARGLLSTAGAAQTTGAALDNAAIKARGFADALSSIQAANPSLAGTIALMGKIDDVNRKLVEGTKDIRDEFQAGKIGDAEAQDRITKLTNERTEAIKAMREESNKPFGDYVRQAEIGRLDTLGQSLARAKDQYEGLVAQAESSYRVEMQRASTPEARGAAEQAHTKRLGELASAYQQVEATARENAAEKGAKAAAGAAKEAAKGFDEFRDKAADAFKATDPAGALRQQGQELQRELDKYRDQLMRTNPEYVSAIEQKIRLNLDGRDIETVKDKSLDLSKEMSRTFSGVFDEMFSAGNKGLTGMLDSVTKGVAKIGTRVVGEAGGFDFNDDDEVELAA